MPARRLAARWVLPIVSPPVEHGAVLIGSDGRIEAVGAEASVPRPAGVETESFGDAILLPGLINTHTHLELTGLAEGPPTGDFPAWIRRLRQRKAERARDEVLAAAGRGVRECWAAGVTTVGDTGDSGSVIEALSAAGGSGVAYQEVFGPDPAQCAESLAGLQSNVELAGRFAGGRVRLGVSPHAPYTVSGPLYSATAAWARHERLPIAVHIAESSDETRLLSRGEGGFAESWRMRRIPVPSPPGDSPVGWLARHGVLSDRTLCIHVIQVMAGDIELLARENTPVAHCPLSNRAHAHGTAPLRAFLDAGLRVGLGTDSVVSVGRLDLLADARAAAALAGLGAEESLDLCTRGGARALGLEGEVGSLARGMWGDCTVIHPGPDGAAGNPAARVLTSGLEDVVATFVGGKGVYRAERTV